MLFSFLHKKFRLSKKNKRIVLFDITAIGIAVIIFISLIYILLRPQQYIEVTLRISGDSLFYTEYENPPFWYSDTIKKGMQEKNAFGAVQAEITDVSSYPSLNTNTSYYYRDNITTKITVVRIKILAVYNKSKQLYTYKSNPISVGSRLRLELNKQLIQGFIINVKDSDTLPKKSYKTIKTKLIDYQGTFQETTGVDPFIADAIPDHDVITDSNGELLIEILKKEAVPALRYTYTDTGEILTQEDPIKKDVYLTLKIRTEKRSEEEYFFNTYRIAVNQIIPIALKNIIIEPTITEIL